MNKDFGFIILAATLLIAGASCGNTKTRQTDVNADSTTNDRPLHNDSSTTSTTPNTSVPASMDSSASMFSISGTIGTVTSGKDGYMADLRTDDGHDYSMTVSILRLQQRFVRFNTGDKVSVSGDTIHLGEKINVLVRDYKKL